MDKGYEHMRYKLCQCGGVREDRCGGSCQKCGAGKQRNKSMTTTERGYDYAWRKLSERVREEQPLCEMCLKNGIVTPTEESHHIVPISIAPWLRLVRSNIMSVCKKCHDEAESDVRAAVEAVGGR